MALSLHCKKFNDFKFKGLFTWREGDLGTRVTLPAGLKHSPPLHGRAIRAGYHISELSFLAGSCFGGLMFWRTFFIATARFIKHYIANMAARRKAIAASLLFLSLVPPF